MLNLTVWRVWSYVLPAIVSMLILWVNLAWQHVPLDILRITDRENVCRIVVIYTSRILWPILLHVSRCVHLQHMLIHFSSNAWQHVQIHTTPMVVTTHVCSFVHLVSLQMIHRNLVWVNVLIRLISMQIVWLINAHQIVLIISLSIKLLPLFMAVVCSIALVGILLIHLRWVVLPNVPMVTMDRLSIILVC